ncbi:WD repeat-containing protein 65 [Durusdinium trenchii]|uniref:WD repeat-containing protein 65 n=1 Tax=Durusdinium trenchii TaxID=1381693 RepID=A0ABP0KFW8_9DINO
MLPEPASSRRCPVWPECPWDLWDVASVMLQIYIWYIAAGEAAAVRFQQHDEWLTQLWAAQLGAYLLSWISLHALLRQVSLNSWRPVLGCHVQWRKLWPALGGALVLGFVSAPARRGQLLPTSPTPLHAELRAAQHMAAAGEMPSVAGLLLLVGFVAPAFEELIFRGFLLMALGDTGSPIFISSCLFGLFHCHPNGPTGFRPFLPSTLLGAWFAFVLLKTRSLKMAILLHQSWNAGHILLVVLLTRLGAQAWVMEIAVSCYA